LTEENLLNKMTEFMTAIDQVKKYRKFAATLIDFIFIIAASITILLTLDIGVNVLNLYGITFSSTLLGLLPVFNIIILCVGVFTGIIWVSRKMDTVKTQQWKNTLNEGTSGALKLLQETNWETIFSDICSAKIGFAFYGALKVVAYWLITIFLFAVIAGFTVFNLFHFSFNISSLLIVSFVFALVLSVKDLCNRYEQVGRLDSLLWELRWFEGEFRRTDFQA
jgi:hypothetical protein